MTDYQSTTKKSFLEGTALAYKLLRKHREMSIQIELSSSVYGRSRLLRVQYWVYSYRNNIGEVATFKDLEKTFKRLCKE